MNKDIIIGGLYRHINSTVYRVECLAFHSVTKEKLVVCISLKDHKISAIPMEIFQGEVDYKRYPDIKQRYRFERIERI